jgi:ABC-type Mn2+/Zn2+ transport system ATPase subunit
MNDAPVMVLEGVSAGYGRHAVLSNLHLGIACGSFTGLLGPNGAGKTTLLKTLAGILPPLTGQIRHGTANGEPLVLGYVPQRQALDDIYLFSCLEVALMGACGRVGPGRWLGNQEKAHARECLQQAGAGDLAQRRFAELSGGEKQRVLIARALATRARVLLLDEPTSALDARSTQGIMELLQQLHRQQGLTLVMVNHDLGAVRRCATEIVWLHQGGALTGRPEELLTRERIAEIMNLQLELLP